MEEELTEEDTLISWLKRDSRYKRFPVEISREWRSSLQGDDELIIRLRYQDDAFIDFPYNSNVYNSAWNLFNKYWESGRISSSEVARI